MNKKIFCFLRLVLLLYLLPFAAFNADKTPCSITIIPGGKTLGSPANPVKCNREDGEKEYLERLRDPAGNPVEYIRIGHAHPTPNGPILDKYEIRARDGSICAQIFMDMNCPGTIETNPIKGFQIIGTPRPAIKKAPKKFVGKKTRPVPIKKTIKKKASQSKRIHYTPPEKLTAAQIYRMIVDNGFYCEIVKSPLHYEGLKGINLPKNGAFKFRRRLFTGKEGEMISTLSMVGKEKLPVQKRIELKWSSKVNKFTFSKAVKVIARFNQQERKKRDWRLPTVMELFSIIIDDNNHFPAEFKFPRNKTMYFWTSTALKKEGTALAYEKEKKAHIIIRNRYNPKTKNYSLSFAFQNIGSKEKAYLIPVVSRKNRMYTFNSSYRNSNSQYGKLGGFEMKKEEPGTVGIANNIAPPPAKKSKPTKSRPTTVAPQNDKIPGFDDGPVTPRKVPPKKPPKTTKKQPIKTPGFDDPVNKPLKTYLGKNNVSQVYRIGIFPYMWNGEEKRKVKFLDDINQKIRFKLESLCRSLERKQYPGLKTQIVKMNPYDYNDVKDITRLYNMLTPFKTGLDNSKAMDVIVDIMKPNRIDILIALNHEKINGSMDIFRIAFIDRLNQEFHPLTTFVSDKLSPEYDGITKSIKQKTENIFHDYFNGVRKGLHFRLKK